MPTGVVIMYCWPTAQQYSCTARSTEPVSGDSSAFLLLSHGQNQQQQQQQTGGQHRISWMLKWDGFWILFSLVTTQVCCCCCCYITLSGTMQLIDLYHVLHYSCSKSDAFAFSEVYGSGVDSVLLLTTVDSLKQTKGRYLPAFSPAERQLVRGSLDFIAANCFTAKFVTAGPGSTTGWRESKYGSDGKLIGLASGIPWMNIVPWSQEKFLRYLSSRYSPGGTSAQKIPILISSLGTQVPGEEQQRLPAVLQDTFRVNFYRGYVDSICSAVKSGQVNLLGVYAWSLFDGFEWTDGYRRKFGLIHVQYAAPQGTPGSIAAAGGGLKRSPKQSALWWSRNFWQR